MSFAQRLAKTMLEIPKVLEGVEVLMSNYSVEDQEKTAVGILCGAAALDGVAIPSRLRSGMGIIITGYKMCLNAEGKQ
jgi:hypothetical protein